MYIIHPWGVPVALFLTIRRVCEVLIASKPKRTVTPFMYMHHDPPLPIGDFQQIVDTANLALFCEKEKKWGKKCWGLMIFKCLEWVWLRGGYALRRLTAPFVTPLWRRWREGYIGEVRAGRPHPQSLPQFGTSDRRVFWFWKVNPNSLFFFH